MSGPESSGGGVSRERAVALARVRELLHQQGVDDATIDAAVAEDVVDLLVAERLIVPGPRCYGAPDVAEASGVPLAQVERLWRALGFPAPGPGERIFTELDVDAVMTLRSLEEMGVADATSIVQMARVIGSSMARIAEAEVSQTLAAVPTVAEPGDSVIAADRFAHRAGSLLPALARLLEFVWRQQLRAATQRAAVLRQRGGGAPELVVGFADMVGFTDLSRRLSPGELAHLLARFESVAHETVTGLGGRVVKLIGDEVMFVAEAPAAGVRIGSALVRAYAADPDVPEVRVGLALGAVLLREGDYFGPVVNLASRLVALARPGTVLVSEPLRLAVIKDSVGSGAAFDDGAPARAGSPVEIAGRPTFRALRPRFLRGIGSVPLWVLDGSEERQERGGRPRRGGGPPERRATRRRMDPVGTPPDPARSRRRRPSGPGEQHRGDRPRT